MDAADEAPDPLERFRIVEIRRAAAAARVEREQEPGMHAGVHRRHHRDLALGQLACERVLLFDLSGAPASRPVELEHTRGAVLEPGLVDAVLVAVERQEPPVGAQSRAIAGVEHDFRGQRGVRMGHGVIVDAWRRTTSRWRALASPTATSRSFAACRSPFRTARWW